ncbi:MAG: ABC transporter ATP-binding protein [Casimicrobiaceae bacterium]
MTPFLLIDNLTASYGGGAPVLDRVGLEVQRGELVALLGSSGCGKTTLLRSIAGFVIPDAGTISIDGRDITRLPPEKRGTAMMFQSYALWPHMSVAQNIGYGLRMRGWKKDAIANRVVEMLTLLQLQGYGERPVTALSGGQRQRVALGRALAVSPEVLLLDEPMSNLDYKVRIELRQELRALQQRIGITAVYVTHDREEALTLADRIAVLDAGRVEQYDTPEIVYHRPASPFVAGFMGADNAIAVRGSGRHWQAAADIDGARAVGSEGGAALMRAHFRSDAARLVPTTGEVGDGLVLNGTVAQTLYVGQGYRYRVRLADGDVWVHAPERIEEGTAARVTVPHQALLFFPLQVQHAS